MPRAPVLTVTLIMGTTILTPIWITGLPAKNHRESTNMSQKRWTVLPELSMSNSSPIQDIITDFPFWRKYSPNPCTVQRTGLYFFLFSSPGLFIRFVAGKRQRRAFELSPLLFPSILTSNLHYLLRLRIGYNHNVMQRWIFGQKH